MEQETKETNKLNFYLPEDLLLKIFLLLPFESILACKLVSKQWKNLINNRNFSKRYHHKGSMIVFIDAHILYCVLLKHTNEITRYPSYRVHIIPITLFNFDSIRGNGHELLSEWSNGVACVKTSNGYFFLYDLFTGVLHTVKDAPLRSHSELWTYYGFGYDCNDDDYKIMVVCDYQAGDWLRMNKGDIDKVQNKENSLFWVYSYRNRSWKSYDGFPAAYCWPRFSLGRSYSVNGVLHFATLKGFKKRMILTYDLHTRGFGEILVSSDDLSCDRVELDPFREWVRAMYDIDVGRYERQLLSICSNPSMKRSFYSRKLVYMARHEWGDEKNVVLSVHGSTLKWYDSSKNESVMVSLDAWLMERREQRLKMRGQQMRKGK